MLQDNDSRITLISLLVDAVMMNIAEFFVQNLVVILFNQHLSAIWSKSHE
tara:strand:+ start:257 stop:406 length:150 start_codon:yes stop_codon:yes gene_type:complete